MKNLTFETLENKSLLCAAGIIAGGIHEPDSLSSIAGDITGDGQDDVIVRHRNGVDWVAKGLTEDLVLELPTAEHNQMLFARVFSLGDINRDGIDDLAVEYSDGGGEEVVVFDNVDTSMIGRGRLLRLMGVDNQTREYTDVDPFEFFDFNSDGVADDLVRCEENGKYMIHLNEAPAHAQALEDAPEDITISLVDGVVHLNGATGPVAGFDVYTTDGEGQFTVTRQGDVDTTLVYEEGPRYSIDSNEVTVRWEAAMMGFGASFDGLTNTGIEFEGDVSTLRVDWHHIPSCTTMTAQVEQEEAPVEPQWDNSTGDIDGDNFVGFQDFLELARNFGKTVGAGTARDTAVDLLMADIDESGMVDFGDFLIVSQNFGQVVNPFIDSWHVVKTIGTDKVITERVEVYADGTGKAMGNGKTFNWTHDRENDRLTMDWEHGVTTHVDKQESTEYYMYQLDANGNRIGGRDFVAAEEV